MRIVSRDYRTILGFFFRDDEWIILRNSTSALAACGPVGGSAPAAVGMLEFRV